MAIKDVESKCWILALFVRDDGERFLLGDGSYEFSEKQLHFAANTMANDVVEVQGNDGYLLAGQVRRPSTQTFDGYVGDSSTSKAVVEERRRAFFEFFRKNFFYKVIYIFPDGSAIQRKRGFLVDAPEVKEIRQIYPEYHVALNFEDINYYYYDEDSDGQEIYGKSATINLNSVAQSGGLIWLLPSEVTLTGEGTNFTLSGTVNGTALTSAELKGDTYQQTYSGKNLFAMPSSQTVNGVTMTVHNDGTFDLSGTASATGIFYVIKPLSETDLIGGDTYTLHIPQDMQWALPIFVQSSQADGTYSKQLIAGGLQTGISKTAVLENPDTQYVKFIIQVVNGNTYNLQNFYVQLEAGSTATSYEPYTGGIPAPNPDYPQEVQTATGRQLITLANGSQSQEYEVNLGKNLWGGLPSVSRTTSGIVFTNNEDGTITANGTAGSQTAHSMTSSEARESGRYISLDAGTYTLSAEDLGIGFIEAVKAADGTAIIDNAGTFTLDSTTDVFIRARVNSNSGTINTTIKPQLEKGSTASSYASYFEPIELCKIGDYQDRIYKSGDGWYLHKEVEHLSLAITNMNNYEDAPGWSSVENIREYIGTGIVGPIVSATDYCSNITSSATIGGIRMNTNSSNAVIYLPPAVWGSSFTQTYWKTNYPNLTLELYYGIAVTPSQTDTQITNTALIAQLNALAAATTYNGSTNFTVDGNGNLAAILAVEVEAVGGGGVEWDENGAVWEEGKPSYSIISVDSIDNVYPVLTITGRTVNPVLTDVTTGTVFQYNGTITESQVLRVDMMNKTATLNGVSVIGNVTGDWLYLAPGNNRVTYTADNADAPNATVEWQEIVG